MSMYLAAILGLFGLTVPYVSGAVFPAHLPQLSQDTPAAGTAPVGEAGTGQQSEPASPAQTTPPPQPAQEPQETQAPPAAAKPEPGTSESQTSKPQTSESQTAESKKAEPASKTPHKKRKRHKTVASSNAPPEKKVVRNGSTADPVVQLAPGMSAEQASSQRQNTTQLMAATDANLKQISARQLNSSQQDSVSQIRKYIEQAKAAEQAGDVQRAHNLASKALLLSDDLAKH
jgi:hypothetical protein